MAKMTMYWSERGTVACAVHTPVCGCDLWVQGGWEAIPLDALADWEKQIGAPPQCEECARRHARAMTMTTEPKEAA